LGRRAIDFRHAFLKTKSFQTDRVRPKGIRFNHPGARGDVLLMNRFNPIRLRHTELFETPREWDSCLQEQSPHCPIAAQDPRMELVE
jgi:hypothetical protein